MRTVHFYFFFFVTLLFVSCDSSEDYFLYHDNTPVVLIKKEADTVFVSSISDSFKLSPNAYNLNLKYFDEEQLKLNISTSFATDSVKLLAGNLAQVFFNSEGLSKVSFTLIDCYGKSAVANLNVTTFRNLPPVAMVTLTKTATHSPYEILIDASKSYDLDAKFGGAVVLYEYKLNNLTRTTSASSISYIFGTPGQKVISVKVKDNDGAWSEEKTEYISL